MNEFEYKLNNLATARTRLEKLRAAELVLDDRYFEPIRDNLEKSKKPLMIEINRLEKEILTKLEKTHRSEQKKEEYEDF